MVACVVAYRSTGDAKWLKEAVRAFEWFLGRNHLGRSMYNPVTGGVRDGLRPADMNMNEGAESIVSFLDALIELKHLDVSDVAELIHQSAEFGVSC